MTPRNVVSAVAWGLVGTMFIGVLGIIALAMFGRPVPDVVANVTLTVVGAVAGLLARTGSDDAPQRVEVVNQPQDPVPTTDLDG